MGGNNATFTSRSFTAGTEQPIQIGWNFPINKMGVAVDYGHAFALDFDSSFVSQAIGGAECHLYYGDQEIALESPTFLTSSIGQDVSTRAYIFKLKTPEDVDNNPCPLNVSPATAASDPTIVYFDCFLMRPRRFFPQPQFFLSTVNPSVEPKVITSTKITSAFPTDGIMYPAFTNVTVSLNPPALLTFTNVTITFTHNPLIVPRGTGLSILGTSIFDITTARCWVNNTLTSVLLASSNRINVLMPFQVEGPATLQVTCAGLKLRDTAPGQRVWVEYFTTEGDSATKGYYFAGGVTTIPQYPRSLTLNTAKFVYNTVAEESGVLIGTVTGTWPVGLGYPLRGGQDMFQFGFPSGFQPTYSSAVLGEEGSLCQLTINDVNVAASEVFQNLDLATHNIQLRLSYGTSLAPKDKLVITCTLIRSAAVLREPSFDVKTWIVNVEYSAITHSNTKNRISAVAPITHITGKIEAAVTLTSNVVGTRTTMNVEIANIPPTVGKELRFLIGVPLFRPTIYSSTDFPVECLLKSSDVIIAGLSEDISTSAYDITGRDDGLMYFTLRTDNTVDFPSATRISLTCTNMMVYNRFRDSVTTAGYIAIYEGVNLYGVIDGIRQPPVIAGTLFTPSQSYISVSPYAGMVSPSSNKQLTFVFYVPFILPANNGGAIISLPATYRLSLSDTPRACTVTLQNVAVVVTPEMLTSPTRDRIYFYLPFSAATVPFSDAIVVTCPLVLPSTASTNLFFDTITVQAVDSVLSPPVNQTTFGTRVFTSLTVPATAPLNRVDPLMDGSFCSSRCTFELTSPYPDELTDVNIYMHPLETGNIGLRLTETLLSATSMTAALPNCTITANSQPVDWTLTYNSITNAFLVVRTGSSASGPLAITCPGVRVAPNVVPAKSFVTTSYGTTQNAFDAMTAPSITARPTVSSLVFNSPSGQPSTITLTMENAPALPVTTDQPTIRRLLRVPLPVGTGGDPNTMGVLCEMTVDEEPAIQVYNAMMKHQSKLVSELLIVIPVATDAGKKLTFNCLGFIAPNSSQLPFQSIDIASYEEKTSSLAPRTPSRYTILYSLSAPRVTLTQQPTLGKYISTVVPQSVMTISHSGSARFIVNPFPLTLPAKSQIIFALPPSWNVPSTPATGSTSRCAMTLKGQSISGTVFARRLWDTSANANGRDATQWRELRFVTSVKMEAVDGTLELVCQKVAVPTVVTGEELGYVTILAPDGAIMLSQSNLRLPPIFRDQEGKSNIRHLLTFARRAPFTSAELGSVVNAYQGALGTASSVIIAKQQVISQKLILEFHVDVIGYHQPDGVVYLNKHADLIAANMANAGYADVKFDVSLGYRIEDCYNARKTRQETDVDCGGNDCSGCSIGKSCLKDLDCLSLNCLNKKCADYGLTSSAPRVAAGFGMVALIVFLALMGV